MTALYAILLGIVQGILEFLPVSSFGHLLVLENLLGFSTSSGILFETLLHTGTLITIILVFKKDILRILLEFLAICLDIWENFRRYLRNRHSEEAVPYVKIVTSGSRKLTVMLFLSFVPTFLIGFSVRNLAAMAADSPAMAPIGFLMTGIVMLVIDLGTTRIGRRGIAQASYDQAMWLGVTQGIAAFPGISRLGLSLSLSQLFEYRTNFAIRYSFLMSVPAVLGATLAELPRFAAADMTAGTAVSYILGMLAAGITSYFAIRFLLNLLGKIRLRYFAFYCFLIGIFVLVREYL